MNEEKLRKFFVKALEIDDAFDTMLDENELDREITQAETEYRMDGKVQDARETFSTLRKKHIE